MTQAENMEMTDTESQASERLRPKIGRIPANLRLLNTAASQSQESNDITLLARKEDTRFTIIVALFIIVNLLLVAMLTRKDQAANTEHPAPPVQTASVPEASKPVPSITPAETAIKTSQPALLTPAAPPAAAKLPAASHPPAVIATQPPVAHAPASPAYVTPVSPATTKALAAPVQPVTTISISSPPPASAAPQDNLVVIHAPALAESALPAAAPAAGNPSPAAPPSPPAPQPSAGGTQDLLSVINKD